MTAEEKLSAKKLKKERRRANKAKLKAAQSGVVTAPDAKASSEAKASAREKREPREPHLCFGINAVTRALETSEHRQRHAATSCVLFVQMISCS